MKLGISLREVQRPTLADRLDAVCSYGLECFQFNFRCVGLNAMPERIEPAVCDEIRREVAARRLELAAVSGTFNMSHPDPEHRRDGLRRLEVLAAACQRLGTSIITLCTGTRDPEDMWRAHPDNDTPEAWRDTVQTIGQAVQIAERFGVTAAFEPEVANVVDSARKARRLLDEIGSPRLKVLIDPANLFHRGELPRMAEVLDEAFALLGKDIVLAHAKDLTRDGEAGHEAAGTGLLDYERYLGLLQRSGFAGAIILHSLKEAQLSDSVAFLRRKMPR